MRRKHFRERQKNDTLAGLSVTKYILAEFITVILVTIIQLPLCIAWYTRSCSFLQRFVWYWTLAQLARLSIVGLMEDLVWYGFLCVVGHKKLCPHCTERIIHCDCFNDGLLKQAVAVYGHDWQRIMEEHSEFREYSSVDLEERWQMLCIDDTGDAYHAMVDIAVDTPVSVVHRVTGWLDTFDS